MGKFYTLIYVAFQIFVAYIKKVEGAYNFEVHLKFMDTYCSDHAQSAGIIRSKVECGLLCSMTTECRGFFHNSVTGACTLVAIIAVPYSGCVPETGSTYYIMLVDGLFDCYYFTDDDRASISNGVSTRDVCTRYKYHTWSADVGSSHRYGCQPCGCCKSKGCYTGNLQHNNGTWSRTTSGRCYTGNLQHYNGTWSRTTSGRECQRWDSQTPQPHNRWESWTVYPPGETYVTAKNYCRDPDWTGFIWCYTTDPDYRYETCGIPTC